ncbi:MAG: ABC transporter permease [Treponema sp.]|nr:ABC transporter permease [Treponema sp.]
MNVFYVGSAINLASLYMAAGLGASLSVKSGQINLGGEGQVYAGGFIAAALLAGLPKLPSLFALPLAFAAAFAFSGLLAFFCAFLKIKKNADYLFTSFITSAAVIPFVDGLISGPFRSKSDNLLATAFIPQKFRLLRILKPSPLNISLFFTLALCLAFFFILYRTSYGRRLQVFGISPFFARYSGYKNDSLFYSSSFISGGMHGLCGALAISGTYFACHSGFYGGMGWNSLSAALIARSNPLLLIPSSLGLAFLTTYANKAALYNNFGFDVSALIQALVLLLIAFPYKFPASKGGAK